MFFLFTEPREDRGTVRGGPADIPMMLHGGGGRVMLAFRSKALAEGFRIGTDMEEGSEVLSILEIPTRDPLWNERPSHVLLFSSQEQIEQYRQDKESFPFDQHIFRLQKERLRRSN